MGDPGWHGDYAQLGSRGGEAPGATGARLQQARDGARARRDAARGDTVLQQAERQVRHIEATLEQVRKELAVPAAQPQPTVVTPHGDPRAVRQDTARMIGESLAALRGPIATLQRTPERGQPLPREQHAAHAPAPAGAGAPPPVARALRDDFAQSVPGACPGRDDLRAPCAAPGRALPPPPPQPAALGPRAPAYCAAPRPQPVALSAALPSGDPARRADAPASPPRAPCSGSARAIEQQMAALERRISQHARDLAAGSAQGAQRAEAAPPERVAQVQQPPALAAVGADAPPPPREQQRREDAHHAPAPAAAPAPAPAAAPRTAAPQPAADPDSAEDGFGGWDSAAPGRASPIAINADDLAAIPARGREEELWRRFRCGVGDAPQGTDPALLRGCARLLQLREEYCAEERRVQTAELGLLLERRLFRDKSQRIAAVVAERSGLLAARQRAGEPTSRDEMIFLNAVALVLKQGVN
eukprot:TRINITY_DN5338_c0_g2_i4.p1 TRINITY_DN5338_c0_g2~~TRINITY_DN5338_c0_g2_i4.p1  ORF type:complete len:473 (+),score=149.20 TRINITY_DN5338_c0_g2_i4:98-1516(+)